MSLTMISAEEIDVRRHQARRREIVERILFVVEELLDETDSYLDLKVETILKLSGLGRSTFYRYFADKNELLLALGQPALEDVMHAALDPWQLESDTTLDEFEAKLRNGVGLYRPHISLMKAMVEVSTYDARVKQQFLSSFGIVRTGITAQIARGQEQGFLRRDINASATAGWLTWAAERGMDQLIGTADDAEREVLIHDFAALVWHSVHE